MPYKDPKKRAKYQKAYRERNREKLRAACRRYDHTHRDEAQKRHLVWCEDNRAHVRSKARQWHAENRERINAKQREAYQRRKHKDPEKHRRTVLANHLRAKYGMTVADFDKMLVDQQQCCALCHEPMELGGRIRPLRAVVDHDHVTGVVRGLIHSRCNKLLGFAEDSVDRLAFAISYLRSHQ